MPRDGAPDARAAEHDAPNKAADPPSGASASTILVLPHTHWDREWYHLAGRFRQRLVALVDELLDARTDAGTDAPAEARDHAPFLLDGQAIVLEDYLAVRPDRREILAESLRAGRLEAGPWYVLADGLIPGAESLVRNLLVGRRLLRQLDAPPPPVLYAPDAFGHPAAGPILAHGFGLRTAMVWRGAGGVHGPDGDAAWWRGPAGERVLLLHLPPDGYEFGSRLPVALPAARERWAAIRAVLEPRARLGFLLVMNGADHHARQERWAEAIDTLRRAADPIPVDVVSLSGVAARAVAAAEHARLPEVSGELRSSYGHAWTLQGTFASRTAQKRRAARAERTLVRDTEPWVALVTLAAEHAVGHATEADTRRAVLDAAWRELLRCHPHDTLCGCSIDGVARAMDGRLDEVATQQVGIRRDAIDALVGHDVVRTRGLPRLWRPYVLVRNPAPRARGGVARVAIHTFVRDVAVGPGSRGQWRSVHAPGAPVHLADAEGRPVALQVLDRALQHDRIESPRHYPDDDLVEVAQVLAWVSPVPGYGIHALRSGNTDATARDATAAATTDQIAGPATPARAGDGQIDNGLLRVTVDPQGRIRVHDLTRDLALDDVLGFEDVGDAGDLYTHSPIGQLLTFARFGGVRVVHRGPLRAALEARYEMRIPEGLAPDPEDPFSRRTRRTGRAVSIPLTVTLSLDADEAFVRLRITGANRARDHRLRVVFRTGIPDARIVADAAFGPVPRVPVEVPPSVAAVERPPRTAPLHRYVSAYAPARGVTVVSDGLAEYEATPTGDLAITLVRAVGELSRPDLPERPGHAGWPASTPEAQGIGPFAAEFACALHGPDGDATRALVERIADDASLPLTGDTLRAAVHPPVAVSAIELDGDGLAFGAAKPAEQGNGWIALRAINVTDRAVEGVWRIRAPDDRALREACLARLDETPLDALRIAQDAGAWIIPFVAPPRAVITVLAR